MKKSFEYVTDAHVNDLGAEYLRALWVRREAAMSAPFTVSEDMLFREERDQGEQQTAGGRGTLAA